MMSFLEHIHVERIFISSDLCRDNSIRQLKLAAKAIKLMTSMKLDSGTPPAMKLIAALDKDTDTKDRHNTPFEEC